MTMTIVTCRSRISNTLIRNDRLGGRMRAFEQETQDLNVEIKQMKELKARNMMGEVNIDTLTIEQYLMFTQGNQAPGMVKTEFGRMMEKDIENMTIAEYMEYEAEMVWGYAHHSGDSKINAYYDLPPLLPCFKPIQPHTKDRYEPLEEDTNYVSEDESETGEQRMINDTNGNKPFTPKPQPKDGGLSSDENIDEWLKTEMEKHMCGQDKENEEDALIAILKSLVGECKAVHTNKGAQTKTYSNGTNEVQGVSFVADDEEGDISRALPCQLPPKELNPGSFTLPCTIGSIYLYVMANLGASVNVMPKSIFEHLKLANLKETDMVVEMADMKKCPIRNREPSETMILGRPFLATIHAQIDVFKKEISLGIREDRVKFDMDGGVSHSGIPVEKIYMANSIQEEDVDTLDSADNMQELEDKHEDMMRGPNLERIISR
ncbi:hypothetical protein Tco_0488033 [Tanacetum coccineum]